MTDDSVLSNIRCQEILTALNGYELDWSALNVAEKKFVTTVEIKCAICHLPFSPYDSRQGRLRQYCSDKCSRLARKKRPGPWVCALCGHGLACPKHLEMHLAAKHKNIDKHQYTRIRLEKQGRDVSALERHCPECGRERRLDFARSRYVPCHCVSVANKLTRVRSALAKETNLEKRKRMARQVGGLTSQLKKLRPLSIKPVTEQVSQKMMKPATTPSITCSWTEGLYSLSGYFTRVLQEHHPVFARFYSLLEHLSRPVPTKALILDANDSLSDALTKLSWVRYDGTVESGAVSLFVWALDKDSLVRGEHSWQEFRHRVQCDAADIDRLRDSFTLNDPDALATCLKDMKTAFEFPLLDSPTYQCWQRMVTTRKEVEERVFNPMAMLAVYNRMTRSRS